MKFTCGLCKKEVKRGAKFSIESTEWEECETIGNGGGVDEGSICKKCNDRIINKIESMRK